MKWKYDLTQELNRFGQLSGMRLSDVVTKRIFKFDLAIPCSFWQVESDCFWRSWFNICTYSSYLFEQVNCCGWEPSLHPLPSTWPHFPRYLGSRKDTLHSLTHTDSMTSTARILAFKLSPPSQDGSPERLFSCDEDIERRYEVVPSVVCSMCCLFGIIYCFFGRLQRMNELIIFRLQTAEHTGLEKCRFT